MRIPVRHKSETALASITLALAVIHFFVENYAHFKWGQPLQALVVDYIWMALAVLGGLMSLRVRPHSAAGLLAASWGFAVGFAWRSAFGRLALTDAERASGNGEPVIVTYFVLGALTLAFCLMFWALWLAYRQSKTGIESSKHGDAI